MSHQVLFPCRIPCCSGLPLTPMAGVPNCHLRNQNATKGQKWDIFGTRRSFSMPHTLAVLERCSKYFHPVSPKSPTPWFIPATAAVVNVERDTWQTSATRRAVIGSGDTTSRCRCAEPAQSRNQNQRAAAMEPPAIEEPGTPVSG